LNRLISFMLVKKISLILLGPFRRVLFHESSK
jgi:hypothetical protein